VHSTTDVAAPVLEELRDRRRALRGEISEVGHWRRLLRAKIDLAVSRGAGPQPLHPTNPHVHEMVDVAGLAALDLPAICRVPAEGFALGSLPQLRSADSRLASYEVELRSALMHTTDEIVRELTAPSSTSV